MAKIYHPRCTNSMISKRNPNCLRWQTVNFLRQRKLV